MNALVEIVRHLGFWDYALLVVVSLQSLVMAYLYAPRWKAFILSLPFPFTVTVLALGQPVDATNLLGLVVLAIFTHGVRLLHWRLRLSIVPAIVLCAGLYCAIAWPLARIMPRTEFTFALTFAAVMLGFLALLILQPPRDEPGHREPLPIWLKLPGIAAIAFWLVIAKHGLQGFVTVFPMVGVFAAYESRHSLWTNSRQISILSLTMAPAMAVIHYTQPRLGLPLALLCGWALLLSLLIPATIIMWRRENARRRQAESPAEPAAMEM